MRCPVVALCATSLFALAGGAVRAQALPAPAAAPAAAPAPAPEPAVQRRVLEDDNVRIEELRVRGLNQRLTVQPKTAGVRAYEILPDEPGRDGVDRRTSAGQRVWRLLSF
ncbi:MAG: hypothetical protein ABIX12_14680 [Rubrivivax sp.]